MKNRFKNIFLLTSVCITGSAVLVIEIVAIRILSPYYGNTIYTASSVIGTVLAALSLGYYIGGRLADRYPSYIFFYGIIFISGIVTIFIQLLNYALLPFFGVLFSIVTGPLISSIFLFFVPAFCLATLSPFAIKLYKKNITENEATLVKDIAGQGKQDRSGEQAGEIFFFSTMGSIVGSLASGFILIPHFGVNAIIIGTGLIVALWGMLGMVLFGPVSQKVGLAMIALLLFSLFLNFVDSSIKSPGLIYQKDGVYEKIKISDGIWQGRPARFLFQDKSNSAAMYLDSQDLVYDYTKYYALYQLINPNASNSFVIGGGAYSIPKALLKDSSVMHVDVTEIEPQLFNLAKQYFNLQETDRIKNYVEDGRSFLKNNAKNYDVILSDVYYSLFSIPIHFTTTEFFELAKSRLSESGVFIGNFAGSLDPRSPSLIFSEINTFREVFPNSYFFAVNSLSNKQPQNVIFLGINGNKTIDFNSSDVVKNRNPILANLAQKNIRVGDVDLENYETITDNFAPIEYLVSKMIWD